MDRRQFLQKASTLAGSALVVSPLPVAAQKQTPWMSVLGPVDADALGITLIHEHAMVDFIGADETGTHRYSVNDVVEKVLPYLLDLKRAGCRTFVDCTPVYTGRDARVLKRLATESGLNIFTTTGYYGAVQQKFLPPHAYSETEEQLAARWINEWKNGIDGTGVYPGLLKTAVDEGPLPPVCRKILSAVAITHLRTGLSISAHTGNGEAALEEITILQKGGVHPSAFRWIHAQNEKDTDIHLRAAKMGAWIEFDGINAAEPDNIARHLAFVKFMKTNGLLKQTLISQDAGWYWVGEPNGGDFRGYTALFEKFVPALQAEGFTESEIRQLLVDNPRESLRISVRKM